MTNTGKPYEKLTQRVFAEMLREDGVRTAQVQHDIQLRGKTTAHQIDVFWEFEAAGINYSTIVQCKDWSAPVDQGEVLKLKGILDDLPGQPRGVIVAKSGFQSGARDVAKANGIILCELRDPEDQDWEGKVRTVRLEVVLLVPIVKDFQFFVDEPWMKVQQERSGLPLDAQFQISGRSDELIIEDADGKPITTLFQIIQSLIPKTAVETPPTRKRHVFEVPSFLKTGNESVPLTKVTALEATVSLEKGLTEVVEIRGSEMVRAILRDVLKGTTQMLDANLQPVRDRSPVITRHLPS